MVVNNEVKNLLGKKVVAINVVYNNVFRSSKNEILADKIVFHFKKKSIVIVPLKDSDEINIKVLNNHVKDKIEDSLNPLSIFKGLKLNYTWSGVNTNGYSDIFILSFDRLSPSVLILAEGTVLKLFLLQQCSYVKN